MEYAALIHRILEAERTAQELTREVREQEARMEAELEEKTASVQADYMARADKKLARLRQETEQAKAEAIAAQDARYAETRDKMEQAYRQYGDNWVDTLFRQTVGQTS